MQPKSPSPDFDFMLKEQPKRRSFSLPGLPKPALIGIIVVLLLIVLIVVSSVLSGRKSARFQPFVGILARDQETLRITSVAQQLQLQDPQTQAVAATVTSALASDKQELLNYLELNHIKVSSKAAAADHDSTTDTTLESAAQNNGLDSAYISYLRTSLNRYESDAQIASQTAGPNGKKLMNDISQSVKTLLNSPPLKS